MNQTLLNNWQQHIRQYPNYEMQDAVKFIFQGLLGCGHMLQDEQAVLNRLLAEIKTLSASDPHEPLFEPLGEHHLRLNLRPALAQGLRPNWIARMFYQSASEDCAFSRKDVGEEILSWQRIGVLAGEDAQSFACKLCTEPTYLPSHSKTYHAAYAPAYRVISTRFALGLQVLPVIGQMLHEKGRLLITIDGRCGSGKTTLATVLHSILDAAVIHMDHFHVPHAQKTAERLSRPGGNADVDRICQDILHPWQNHSPIVYQPYNCRLDRLDEPIMVPDQPVTILEGTYSSLPAIAGAADLKLFLQMDTATQLKRLTRREGSEGLKPFLQRWIPLEESYFSAFSLPGTSCFPVIVPEET